MKIFGKELIFNGNKIYHTGDKPTPAEIGAAASGHGHAAATRSAAGFQSADDKTKLDGIAAGANNYIHPTTAGYKHIPAAGASGQILEWSSAGTAKWADPGVSGTQVITQATQPTGHVSGRVWVKTY